MTLAHSRVDAQSDLCQPAIACCLLLPAIVLCTAASGPHSPALLHHALDKWSQISSLYSVLSVLQ